jgi:site-specific recombinase XerD
MTLSQCIEAYVRHRRSLGVAFHGEQVRLSAFIKAVGDVEMDAVSPLAVGRYVDGRGPVTQSWFCRYHTLNAFYRFAIRREYVTTSPLPRTKPKPPREFIPYLYSEADMRRLLEAVDARYEEDWLVRPATVRALILLLYATGLRISEALALDTRDVDLRQALLTVRETKFYKTRLVPVGADLVGVLRRYRDRHGRTAVPAPADPFLSDHRGHRISRQTAELVFKRVRQQAGLDRAVDRTFAPRLHDFRHTFALNRLVAWYREEKNVQRLLPHLATYLGHRSVRETQRYLQMTSELTMQAGLRFLRYAEVPHEPV